MLEYDLPFVVGEQILYILDSLEREFGQHLVDKVDEAGGFILSHEDDVPNAFYF